MKSQTQILLIALAISFAVALALTVALFCISHLRSEPMIEGEPPDLPTDNPVDEPDGGESEPPAPRGQLHFISNGNGTCVVAGIGTYTDTCLVIPEYAPSGEKVCEIAAMAFYGCEGVATVQIPASVKDIGNLAFAACPNLVYISVSPSNSVYRDLDGVLYTADEKTLLLYPPMRVGASVSIGSATTRIADMAFYNCQNLSRVIYGGSAEQWELIRIGIKNYSLTAAAKTFESAV